MQNKKRFRKQKLLGNHGRGAGLSLTSLFCPPLFKIFFGPRQVPLCSADLGWGEEVISASRVQPPAGLRTPSRTPPGVSNPPAQGVGQQGLQSPFPHLRETSGPSSWDWKLEATVLLPCGSEPGPEPRCPGLLGPLLAGHGTQAAGAAHLLLNKAACFFKALCVVCEVEPMD